MIFTMKRRQILLSSKSKKWYEPVPCVVYIMQQILARHGGALRNVILYNSKIGSANVIRDLHTTLASVGIEGGKRSDHITHTILYDFEAPLPNDPLVLHDPHNFKMYVQAERD